jgi:3-oxoacyl-(acyl-carrier-protein) synthase
VSYQEHTALAARCVGRTTTFTATGSSISVNAGRVSYLFGLRGPSLTVDTACSSSLVALASSRSYLHSRQCDRALVGGCNVLLTPAVMNMYAIAGMLAPGGRCRVMDASAEGYVRAEAAVVLHVACRYHADGVDVSGGTTGAVILSGEPRGGGLLRRGAGPLSLPLARAGPRPGPPDTLPPSPQRGSTRTGGRRP